jgi:NADH-quinone oxidoreductase subunit C
MMDSALEQLDKILAGVEKRLPGTVGDVDRSFGDMTLIVDRGRVHDVLKHLKEDNFDVLIDIAGVDACDLGRQERFELVYMLYSIPHNLRLRVKVFVPEDNMELPTATDLWQSANWAEREAYDMFGFHFKGHPNLVRILCHREFEGHALRKDYPVMKGQWATGTSDLRPDLERE